jgi:hypothetical protein
MSAGDAVSGAPPARDPSVHAVHMKTPASATAANVLSFITSPPFRLGLLPQNQNPMPRDKKK